MLVFVGCTHGISSRLPDDNPLVQTALQMASVNKAMIGVNTAPQVSERSVTDVEHLQKQFFDLGASLTNDLGIKMNTKCHWLMRHLQHHRYNFGCLPKGSTAPNESKHKSTKKAYRSSNKHRDEIAPQILSTRFSLPSDIEEHELERLGSSALGVRLVRKAPSSFRNNSIFAVAERMGDVQENMTLSNLINDRVKGCSSLEEATNTASCTPHVSNGRNYFLRQRYVVSVAVKYLWWQDHESPYAQHVIRAGDHVRRRWCHDAVKYMVQGVEGVGLVEAIFHVPQKRNLKVALFGRMTATRPEEGNQNVVIVHGNRRYKYLIGRNEDVLVEYVPVGSITRRAYLVLDPFDLRKRHGAAVRYKDVPDTKAERRVPNFFEVDAACFTSLAAATC
ncbi:unnamed protein product [Agarophyton chilense]